MDGCTMWITLRKGPPGIDLSLCLQGTRAIVSSFTLNVKLLLLFLEFAHYYLLSCHCRDALFASRSVFKLNATDVKILQQIKGTFVCVMHMNVRWSSGTSDFGLTSAHHCFLSLCFL